MSNNNFTNCKCQICGDTDTANMALSVVIVNAGYGSIRDGQKFRLAICGKCADKLLSMCKETN